jgi:hypothetical protein
MAFILLSTLHIALKSRIVEDKKNFGSSLML